MNPRPPASSSSLVRAAGVIGFALSGFFDGILLHQVLQWHHLFSLVPGEAWRDMRNQILMDGLFHVLMYVIAAAGLVLLWRARPALDRPGAARRVIGGALVGFGLWNVVDVVGFHWLLGIHRIRVGVPDPLAYDLGWLAAFALPFLLLGWWTLRRTDPPAGGRNGALAASLLALLAPAAGSFAALPSPEGRTAVALFASPADAFAAASAADARVLWLDKSSGLAALAADRPSRLYGHGALFVSRSAAVAGCLAWARL
jgi:uncharacterized membrane protein